MPTSARMPFVIGVTGHTDPASLLEYADEKSMINHFYRIFRDWFEFLNPTLSSSKEVLVPIKLMSGMAKGIDLCALQGFVKLRDDLILEGWQSNCLFINGLLPFPYFEDSSQQGLSAENFPGPSKLLAEDYKDAPNELNRFKKIVQAIVSSEYDSIFQLNPVTTNELKCDSAIWSHIKSNSPLMDDRTSERKIQYVALGMLVSNSAHLLLSNWDGNVPKKEHEKEFMGGTSDITLTKLGVSRVVEKVEYEAISSLVPSPLNGRETGLVCHILTTRKESDKRVGKFVPSSEVKNCIDLNNLIQEKFDLSQSGFWFDRNSIETDILLQLIPKAASEHGKYYAFPTASLCQCIAVDELGSKKYKVPEQKIVEENEEEKKVPKAETEVQELKCFLIEWISSLDSLKGINSDLAPYLNDYNDDVKSRGRNVFSPYFGKPENGSATNAGIKLNSRRQYAHLFTAADNAATVYQTRYRLMVLIPYFLLVFMCTGLWEIYGVSTNWTYLLVLFILFSLFPVIWLFSKLKKYKTKYQVLRGVCEVLRVRHALNFSGVRAVDELLPRSQRKDFPNHDYLIRAISIFSWAQEVGPTQTEALSPREKVIFWINDQISYFNRQTSLEISVKNIKKIAFSRPALNISIGRRFSAILFYTAGVFLFSLMILKSGVLAQLLDIDWLESLLGYGFVFSVLGSGAIKAWTAANGFEMTVDNYSDVRWTMTEALKYLERGSESYGNNESDDKNKNNLPFTIYEQRLILEVGVNALFECMHWSEHQRKLDQERHLL